MNNTYIPQKEILGIVEIQNGEEVIRHLFLYLDRGNIEFSYAFQIEWLILLPRASSFPSECLIKTCETVSDLKVNTATLIASHPENGAPSFAPIRKHRQSTTTTNTQHPKRNLTQRLPSNYQSLIHCTHLHCLTDFESPETAQHVGRHGTG